MENYKIKKKRVKYHRLLAYLLLIPAVFLAVLYIAYSISGLLLLPIIFLFLISSIEFFQIAFNINIYVALKNKFTTKEHVFKSEREKRKFKWVAYLSFIHTVVFALLIIVLDLTLNIDYVLF